MELWDTVQPGIGELPERVNNPDDAEVLPRMNTLTDSRPFRFGEHGCMTNFEHHAHFIDELGLNGIPDVLTSVDQGQSTSFHEELGSTDESGETVNG